MKEVIKRIQRTALRHPTRIALKTADEEINYAQLMHRVKSMADLLSRCQVQRLGLALKNSPAWIIADLAAAELGLVSVPVPEFFSPSQAEHVLADSGVDMLIQPESEKSCLGSNWQQAPVWKNSAMDFALVKPRTKTLPVAELPQGTVKITYSSGSTGEPKGVCLPGRLLTRVCNSLMAVVQELNIERHLSVLPYSTLLENIGGIYLPLILGARISPVPGELLGMQPSLQFNPQQFAQALNKFNPQSLILTPELLKIVTLLTENKTLEASQFHFIAVGGAHTPPPLLQRAQTLQLPVYQGYGLSECGSVVSLTTQGSGKNSSAGIPLPHVKVEIAEDGEVVVIARQLSAYLGDKRNFSRRIRTGDLGYFDSAGRLYIEGRKKNLIVLSTGRNLAPEWVESELLGLSPVRQCLVYGDDLPQVEAILVVDPSFDRGQGQALINQANKRLPAYAQIGAWHYADMPFSLNNGLLTANGRPRRQQIMDVYRPLPQKPEFPATFNAPSIACYS